MTDVTYAKSIDLSKGEFFSPECLQHLRNAKRFAIDIGGSLAKLAYIADIPKRKRAASISDETLVNGLSMTAGSPRRHTTCDVIDRKLSNSECEAGEVEQQKTTRLHFIKFETKYIETCINFVHRDLIGHSANTHGKVIKATGGGAYKYRDLMEQKLGLTVEKVDEMECLITGVNFLLRHIPDEAFVYQKHGNPEYKFENTGGDIFPFLLVNIGSGVSIIKVISATSHERVGGTSVGGGTFWGLGSLLTHAKGFDELLQLAAIGKHQNVDMLVKDIYGGDYASIGLSGNLTASSFGKTVRATKDGEEKRQFDPADIAKSLLHMISNDIGQISYLNARLYGLKRVYFGGFFIRGHPTTMHTISYAINFWSQGSIQALFLRHEGYLGAIGAFLKGMEVKDYDTYTWDINYVGSSGLSRWPSDHQVDTLQLDRHDHLLNRLSCLVGEDHPYKLDCVDLDLDDDARLFWLKWFKSSIAEIMELLREEGNLTDQKERLTTFRLTFGKCLENLLENPFAHGSLTIRRLYDLRTQFIQESGLQELFNSITSQAANSLLDDLPRLLETLTALNWRQRHVRILENLVRSAAGATTPGWCGVLRVPLLQVTLAANSFPCESCLTFFTLNDILSCLDPDQFSHVSCVETGTGSVCVDLSCIGTRLANVNPDLVIVVGIARMVHSNHNAKFTCPVLRVGLVTDSWTSSLVNVSLGEVYLKFDRPDSE